ncbi:MAG: MgtC/SapB family protein [Candidatus Bilamarchaeum sp.]|jgi:putative Mg2+ transporter-C (MgtC) family protein
MLPLTETLLRYLASLVAGLLIGFSRKHKPAGSRTFSLICLGCTIFTSISFMGIAENVDQTRIISQIVSGIGFLGLGVIWRAENGQTKGLTTASAVWSTAALGILIGLGLWFESLMALLMIMFILVSKKNGKPKSNSILSNLIPNL